MKKFLIKVLSFLTILTILLLVLNIFLKNRLINKYSKEYLQDTITSSVLKSLDDNFSEFDESYRVRVKESLKNNSDFQKICDEIYDILINDITNNTTSDLNISNEIINIIEKNYNDIPANYKKYVIEKINNMDFNKLYHNILGYLKERLNGNEKYIRILYEFLKIRTRIILILSLVIESIGIVLLTKSKLDLLLTYGLNSMITGGILVFFGVTMNQILSQILGGMMVQISSFIIVIGIVLIAIGMILKDIYERKA